MKKIIATPILIAILILEIFLLIIALNYLLIDTNGGRGLGGSIALIGFIFFFVVLIVEQLIVRNLKTVKKEYIWIIEIIILVLSLFYLNSNGISIK